MCKIINPLVDVTIAAKFAYIVLVRLKKTPGHEQLAIEEQAIEALEKALGLKCVK